MAVEHDQEEKGAVSEVPHLFVKTENTLNMPYFFIESESSLDVPQFFIVPEEPNPQNK